MAKELKRLYEFGPFRLDPEERRLVRDGEPVPLTPKAFDTLLVLVENSGHVLAKDALMAKVWPDSFVEENNLIQNVSTLRKALAESGGQQYIETVPRRGYRFVATVRELLDERSDLILRERVTARVLIEEIEETSGEPPAELGERAPAGAAHLEETVGGVRPIAGVRAALALPEVLPADRVRIAGALGRPAIRTVVVFGAVALAVALYLALRDRVGPERAGGQPRTLAILPFRNVKGDADVDFLGFSLADAVITKLGYVGALTVRPSSYVDKYRNQAIDPKAVSEELKVDTLLTGSFFREDDDLRITAQLVDMRTNELLWRDAIDVKYDRLLTVQDTVAREIIQGLELKLSSEEADRLELDVPRDPLAYEYFLRGVNLYSTNDFYLAIEMLEKSTTRDPSYAPAWAHLGRSYTARASFGLGGREDASLAQGAYERALAINPEEIEPRIFMANLFTDTNRVEQAVPLLRGILETSPNHAEAHWELGYAYRFAGMLEESIAEGERARRLDPAVKINSSAFNSYLYSGQYAQFMQSLPAGEDVAFILFYRGFGNYYLRNWVRAAADFDRAYELDPSLYTQIGKALSLAIAGQAERGIDLLRDTERQIAERDVTDAEGIYKVAQAYAVLGDRQSALRVLRRSIEGGFFCYPYLTSDALLENIRGEPEFAGLLEQARKRHEEFRRRFL
jgi:DNA-binding winged helix-turn-helix (wHTH) protein/TolB-like protein